MKQTDRTLSITYEPTESLKQYKHNAKLHPAEQIEQLKKSIQEFGFNDPIAIDEDRTIIEGHGRLIAAQQLGMETVPVIILTGLTDQQKKAYILAHNQLTMNTGFDIDILSDELQRITAYDMTDFGFLDDMFGQKEPNPDEIKEDEPPAPPVKPKAKEGDIYQLGQHRLMCGDSTKAEDVSRLMNGEKADLVVTDPPYNVAIGDKNKALNEANGTNSIDENILGDKWNSDEECGRMLWKPAFLNMLQNADDKCAVYCFMPQGGTHMMMMMMMMSEAGWQVKHELIWVKNAAVFSMGRLDYDYKHEPILYGWKNGHNFYAENIMTSILEDQATEFSKMKKEDLVKLLEEIYSDKRPVSVIKEDKTRKNDLHPTMKPVKLLARLIHNSSKQNDLVLDLFGGSGSTLIACEQLGRRCNMMELDPRYVDVIITRWENLTGQKAQQIN